MLLRNKKYKSKLKIKQNQESKIRTKILIIKKNIKFVSKIVYVSLYFNNKSLKWL